jgi:DNA polymerase-1
MFHRIFLVARLFLVDGSGIAYRSFFALRNQQLQTSRGEQTGAVYGYTRFLLKLLKDFQPEYMAVCFDTSAPTFRHLKYPKYKATREKAPDELKAQIPRIAEVTDALGIVMLELEGYEADDVIGTLAKKAETAGIETYLVSSDKDFHQLVGDNTRVINPARTGEQFYVYDREKVKERYGVEPEKVVDVMGLAGDPTDNVPGVPGVGTKTASRLVREFGSLEEILSNLDRIPQSSLRDSLSEFADVARLSKELVRIKTDLGAMPEMDRLRYLGANTSRLVKAFKELEFFSFLSEIPGEEKPVGYSTIDKEELLSRLLSSEAFGFVLGQRVAVSLKSGETFVAMGLHDLAQAFESPEVAKVTLNLKKVLLSLRKQGMELHGKAFDLSLASYLLQPSSKLRTPEHLALHYLDRRIPKSDKTTEQGLCNLASLLLPLADVLGRRLEEMGLNGLYWEVEVPLARVLFHMEESGVLVDVQHFTMMSRELEERLASLVDSLHSMAGFEFNLNSPVQLRKVLFETLNLPTGRKTKTGYSTDTEVLTRLASSHPFPKLLLEYRELFKLKSTYVDALTRLVNPDSGRIHTSFNQTVTSTGRLSSSNPNLQNIPMRSEIGKEIRKGFIAPPGWCILSADYSQIELRVLAHLSGDENLTSAFQAGQDIHTKTAALIFDIPEEEVTPEHRRKAKVVNFGIVYGMSPFGLAKELDISPDEAARFIVDYFAAFPGVNTWIDRTVSEARELGYVKTMMNRVRYVPDINSTNRSRREFAERTAVNTPIQGTAADLIKLAMIRIDNSLSTMKTKLILQIHDELVLEVFEDELETAEEIVRKEMASTLPLNVPVVVEVGVGKDWYEAH